MAKSKNHTSHHQNRKDHRNGIKKPKKIPIRSFDGQDRSFVFNLRKSRRNNKTPKQARHLQSKKIIKNRILSNIVKEEKQKIYLAREVGQALLRKRIVLRSNPKFFIRKLVGERIRVFTQRKALSLKSLKKQ